jgi:hypothetical protein
MSEEALRDEILARWEQVRHSDRAAVDIGISLLKSAILINAGSLVALLALSGQLWKEDHPTAVKVLTNSHAFIWGLGLAVAGSIVAYVYQSIVTRREVLLLDQINERGMGPSKCLTSIILVVAVLMVGLVLASFVEFACGVTGISSALQN